MLDKVRNNLIKHSFQLAGIISPESVPTAEELEDAAHTLNAMLQSWNNDGFRLFKIKTGYMPFISGENEYKLATQAYKNLGTSKVTSFKTIGATRVKLDSISGMSVGDKIIVINSTVSEDNTVKDIDFEKAEVTLSRPLNMAIYKDDSVFYGRLNYAKTEKRFFPASFNSVSYSDYVVIPRVGDQLFVSVEGSWSALTINAVDAANKKVTFSPSFSGNVNITSDFIVFGTSVRTANNAEDYVLTPRLLVTAGYDFIPDSIALPSKDGLGEVAEVESVNKDNTEIVLKNAMKESTLLKLGKERIDANTIYPSQVELSWKSLSDLVPVEELDWGFVRELHVETKDWGFVKDPHDEALDWGNLTGDAELVGFGKRANDTYAIAMDSVTRALTLFHKPLNGEWDLVDVEDYNLSEYNLYMANGNVYLFDMNKGLFALEDHLLNDVYTRMGIEGIVKFKDAWYLISPIDEDTGLRTVVSTTDFTVFSNPWTVDIPSIENEAEFAGKMFLGTPETYTTSDMKTFVKLDVYAQNRCVVGDRLLNLNVEDICSYTLDGIKFFPMPLMLSNETAWGYKDGCSFIAVYGVMTKEGYIGTQIFTANDFNPVWTPQVSVPGKVFNIVFDDERAYFLSDITVVSIKYYKGIKVEDTNAFGFGEKIGRPQEVMNVMKFSFDKNVELPMNPLSLKDFTLLPNKSSGEPVNYCFFRDAKDGKMMVWGTPNKFGEYLRFAYVEPITLLEDANSTPDFPDEYYEAVEDGLAAELAYHFQLPLERIQILQAKADASKQEALLHDNEDTSYDIVPNQRGL